MPLVTAEKPFCRKDASFANYRGSENPANQAMQCLLEVSFGGLLQHRATAGAARECDTVQI
jgi:hypothetical protein